VIRGVDLRCFVTGGTGFGLGHVARSVEIAREAGASGLRVAVALRGDAGARAVVRERCPEVDVESWDAPGDAARPARWTLFDTRDPILPELSVAGDAGAPRVVLDRIDCIEHAEWTVLPNLHARPQSNPRVSQGAAWCIVARELRALAGDCEGEPRQRVLVTLGGADPRDWTGALLDPLAESLARSDLAGVDVVIGRCFGAHEHVLGRVRELGWRAHFDPGRRELGLLMRRAAFAVCGFGVAVYELACLGTPCVYLVHHEGDLGDAMALERQGIGVLGGGGDRFEPDTFQRRLEASALSTRWREYARRHARRVVGDGAGAVRIVERLTATVAAPAGEAA
jgi:spore coat polysaccharide biosynthesis predicted glycosyltransferase SpsG